MSDTSYPTLTAITFDDLDVLDFDGLVALRFNAWATVGQALAAFGYGFNF
jgi:hypothetical protein